MIDWKTLCRPKEREVLELALERAIPPQFQVVLFNDDFTPMEFVIDVLRAVIGLDETEATHITMKVHYEGKGICGLFPEIEAKEKASDVMLLAREEGHPLLCLAEPCPLPVKE